MHLVRYLAATAVVVPTLFASVTASAEDAGPRPKHARVARAVTADTAKKHRCAKPLVEVVAGSESATFSLTKCDGSVAPLGVDELSILARPASAAKPKESLESLARTRGPQLSSGIRRIDARLVSRLELVADHFRKAGQPARILLVSGYRPRSAGSYHASGRALDFRIDGVANETLLEFCKTLPDTGCGYYPNSLFVHMDARNTGVGHVTWIDISHPGEAPKYVSSWPLPGAESSDALPSLPTKGRGRRRSGFIGPRSNTENKSRFASLSLLSILYAAALGRSSKNQ